MEAALLDQVEQSDLPLLEQQFAQLQNSIKDLDHEAWMAMKSLNDKTGSLTDSFDPIRYRQLKKQLQDQLPILETKLRKQRIRSLQARRIQLERELAEIEPAQRETKRLVIEAQKLLDSAWQRHARLDLKAASLESQIRIDFETLRAEQRSLQNLIGELTGITEDLDHDGLSANTENLLIR